MLIVGGNSRSGLLNDVYIMNLSNFEWTQIEVQGEAPTPRYYHTTTQINSESLFVFGGKSADKECNDSYILTINSNLNGKLLVTNF